MKFRKKFAIILLTIMTAFSPVQETKANPLVVNPVTIEVTKTGIALVGGFIISVGATIYEVAKTPKLPQKSTPHDVKEKVNHKGEIIQRRYYGIDGKARVDIDLTDHGFPDNHPTPHKHVWRGGERGKAEPLTKHEYDIYIRGVMYE